MGTKFGAEGQIRCLQLVERLANQVIWESRGKTKVTIVGDHGHSNTPSERIDFAKVLRTKGWRPTQSLQTPEDVVCIEFGLVHFASFATLRPAKLAAAELALRAGIPTSGSRRNSLRAHTRRMPARQ